MQFSIHDIVRIRFKGESEGLRSYFGREWKLFRCSESAKADIDVEFVKHIPIKEGVEFVSIFSAYTPTGDFIYFDRYGNKSLLPFETFGKKEIKIISENSIHPPSFYNYILIPAIRSFLLRKGFTFLHASSIAIAGKGIVFPAWAGTGKSSMVIRFLKDGAEFMSDELAIIGKGGDLYAYPNSLNLYDYNFNEFPELRRSLNREKRMQFLLKDIFEKFVYTPGSKLPATSTLRNVLFKLQQLSKNLVRVKIPAEELFPGVKVREKVPLEKIFFIIRGEVNSPVVRAVEPEFVAQKMARCLEFEFNYYYIYYLMFKFAFPDKKVGVIENALKLQEGILKNAFKGIETYYCIIPYGVNTEVFYNLLRNYVS